MGRSYTYNVIGYSQAHTDKHNINMHADVYPCMTKLEMVRARKQANERKQPIESWQAQTRQGRGMIGGGTRWNDDVDLTNIKTIECPKCKGKDKGCGICDFSGITTKRELGKYLPWQLEPDA